MENARKKPVLLTHNIDDSHQVKALPRSSGSWPYHLDIADVLDTPASFGQKMTFHMLGDTGSVKKTAFQQLVASALAGQIGTGSNPADAPAFLFHLGDIVYNHGEAHEYPGQFFGPYEHYPAPIFAIAGNHDADVNPLSSRPYQSLDSFMQVFCDVSPRPVGFSGGSKRLSMVQPHVYWTLKTPLATIIGLYGNATKFGAVTADQAEWFVEELRSASLERPDKAIIVCVHQAPYSADSNHGSSSFMIAFLEKAYQDAGVKPDVVFSGHVHNYQRFSKTYADGAVIPYIVAGAGGYADLHHIAQPDEPIVTDDLAIFRNIKLENYCDDKHGFLRIGIEKKQEGLLLTGEYYTIPRHSLLGGSSEALLFERFFVPLSYREYAVWH